MWSNVVCKVGSTDWEDTVYITSVDTAGLFLPNTLFGVQFYSTEYVYILNISSPGGNDPIDFGSNTTMPVELYKATYLYLKEYCIKPQRIHERGRN